MKQRASNMDAMTRDTRDDRTARLVALEERVEALEQINVLRGVSKPATKQARRLISWPQIWRCSRKMIEKYRATALAASLAGGK